MVVNLQGGSFLHIPAAVTLILDLFMHNKIFYEEVHSSLLVPNRRSISTARSGLQKTATRDRPGHSRHPVGSHTLESESCEPQR